MSASTSASPRFPICSKRGTRPIARHELVKMLTGLFKGLNYSAPLKNVRRNVVNTLNNSRRRLNEGCPGEFSTVILCRDVLQATDAFEAAP